MNRDGIRTQSRAPSRRATKMVSIADRRCGDGHARLRTFRLRQGRIPTGASRSTGQFGNRCEAQHEFLIREIVVAKAGGIKGFPRSVYTNGVAMRLLKTHVVSHASGDRKLALYHGDLSAIPSEESVDLLIVSAFPDDYQPTPYSLIGALDRRGISVDWLSRNKEVDLRGNFSSWISGDLSMKFPAAGFKRLLCFESKPHGLPTEQVVKMFQALMPFTFGDQPIRSIALPILASGDQRIDPKTMLKAIFEAVIHWLGAGIPIQEVKLVIQDANSAERLSVAFEFLSKQLNTSNGRAISTRLDEFTRHELFVSYAHADIDDVEVLLGKIASARPSLKVFRDKYEIKVGQSWQDEIDRAIELSQRVLAIYSPAYLKSTMCKEEFNLARIRHRASITPIIFPVLLRSVDLPLYMKSIQFFDCRDASAALLEAAANEIAISIS
jgi:hypothetical protein